MVSGNIGTVHAVVLAGLTPYHAVLAEVAVGAMPDILKAGSAVGAVEELLVYETFHAVFAAVVTELTATCAGTAVIAHKINTACLDAFAAALTEPAVGLTAVDTVIAAAFALTVHLEALVADGAVCVLIEALGTKLAIGADVLAVVATAAFLTVDFVTVAHSAVGAGLTVFLVAICADLTAGVADFNAAVAPIAFGANEACAVGTDTAFYTADFVVIHVALSTLGAGISFLQMAFKAKVVIALGAVPETLVASETSGTDGITGYPAESAIGTSIIVFKVTFETLMVLALGAGAAAIVATAATVGAAATKLSHISALYAVVLLIAVPAAFLTAMVTAGADVVVSATCAAELALNVFVPCEYR